MTSHLIAPLEAEPMTLILAWRDPFCLVSDGVEIDPFFGVKTLLTQAKIRPISATLAAGGSGARVLQPELFSRLGEAAASTWDELGDAARAIVKELNDRSDSPYHKVSTVLAGTVGGARGILECGPDAPPDGNPLQNPYGVLGTGGRCAAVARSIGLRWRPDERGDEQLRMVVEAAVDADVFTDKPIWRIDLENGATEPFKWIT